MADQKKLDRWAEQLLDTGKRNNLINFRDTKTSTAEVLFPEPQDVFSRCSVGHVFEVYDPKIPDEDIDEEPSDTDSSETEDKSKEKKLSRDEFKVKYASRIKPERYILAFGQTPNPIKAVKNIAKKAQTMLDETGINAAHLAFGFLKWRDKENSDVFYLAPLLLVHINLKTGSVLDPVKIEVSDDDITVNPTLNYLLQAEYGLTLPEYADGETLTQYFSKVAYTVRGLGWDIINQCKISVFSFLKLNMYEDLKANSEQILQNNNIRALLGEPLSSPLFTGESGPDAPVINNPLIELHTVVDADSSQIEAIEMAKTGKSFVLQGPPGTGKSQTITNIIAECLHDGKKILFVSEKQAALNVVFDKLKKAGLEDFCLELHSHKANKKVVIEELNRTLEAPTKRVSPMAGELIRQKEEAQNKLDEYAVALHQKRDGINKSLYQLFELYSSLRAYPDVKYTPRELSSKDEAYLNKAVPLLEQYVEYTSSIGSDYHRNAWYGFKDLGITYDARVTLKEDLESLLNSYKKLQAKTLQMQAKYETPELNYSNTIRWQSLLAFAAGTDVATPALLTKERLNYAMPFLSKMKELSAEIISARTSLFSEFSEDITRDFTGKDLYVTLTGRFSSFLARTFNGAYKELITKLQLYSKQPEKLNYHQAVMAAEQLMKLQTAESVFHETESTVCAGLGTCYHGPETDWNHVMSDLDRLQSILDNNPLSFCALAKMDPQPFVQKQSEFRKDADELITETDAVFNAQQRVSLQFESGILDLNNDTYDKCVQKLEACYSSIDRLGDWIAFSGLLQQLERINIRDYIDTTIDQNIPAGDIVGAFRKLFYQNWIESILFTVPEFASFSRIKQDQAVQTFIDKDNMQYAISMAHIYSELSRRRPSLDLTTGGSAVAILRREGGKKRKQMPIRKLLSETADLVQLLKPCFLMSPLSVSTFLDPAKISFDTVIFDEASQIFPQDAVGAIYRGKQLIVVGDSRQMPPSNFFNATLDIEDDDEDFDDITGFESILDRSSTVFDTKRLAWHYRSHYEQLIAFSNLHFYNNQLVTFPSSTKDHKGIGVDYFHVDGTFDRRTKTNRKEAEFIVNLVYENIEKYPNRSLGVVAFSVAQQDLIDKLLSRRREADPSHEEFFKADNPEPFFIKNLETVQGDERDTIIFSVAYAKDSQGRFIQNFGPLNRAGGERRLNVAVTRAKDNVQLVASIHYTDIDISNTESQGVKLLRAYLDYAQNGEKALERTISVSKEDRYDSDFELEVCEFLRDKGFTVDTQVGCSGFKIDLGLRLPDSSRYLLAIECDGATYHNSKNARDRDSLRQRVLENMGWRFYRIWSTDWYRNKAVEKERLLNVVHRALDNSADAERELKRKASKNQQEAIEKNYVSEQQQPDSAFPEYHEVDALKIFREKHEHFPLAIKKILETEAPLSEEYLLKRIVSLFQREKVTSAVVHDYELQMWNCASYGVIRRNGFLYPEGQKHFPLRVPGDKREIKYIALEELATGFFKIIKQNVTVTKEGLYQKMTNLLGFSRTGNAIEARYDEAINMLIRMKAISQDGDTLTFISRQ